LGTRHRARTYRPETKASQSGIVPFFFATPGADKRVVTPTHPPHFMTMTRIPTFDHPILISAADIDDMGHVNNTVYLQWVQDAVVQYWQQVSPPAVRRGLLWVALQHNIIYRMPLFLGDKVAALVTATGTRGSRASFTTLFKRGDDLAVEVLSSWCCVDASTRRPRRIAEDIARIFLPLPSLHQGPEKPAVVRPI